MMNIQQSKSFWAVLAAMRWCLAFIVLSSHAYHMHLASDIAISGTISLLGGKAAVVGFFLISGASIAHSYRQSPEGYLQRRFLRIYPLYFVAVSLAAIVAYLSPPSLTFGKLTLQNSPLLTYVGNYFFMQGFVGPVIAYNGPLWSLSIEVFYYILAPLFFRLNRGAVIGLIVMSMLFYVLDKQLNLQFRGCGAIRYLWPWLAGFLLIRENLAPSAILLSLAGIPLLFWYPIAGESSLSWIPYAATLTAMLGLSRIRTSQWLVNCFNKLGDLSYPVYLFHVPLSIAIVECLGPPSFAGLVFLNILCAVLLQYIFETKAKHWFWQPTATRFSAWSRSAWTRVATQRT